MDLFKTLCENSDIDIERLTPRLRIKFNDSIVKLKGKKVSCNDFISFARTSEGFIPLFVLNDKEASSITKEDIFSALPLICIGAAEILVSGDFINARTSSIFLSDLYEDLSEKNILNIKNFIESVRHYDSDKDYEKTLLFGLKSLVLGSSFEAKRKLAEALYILYYCNTSAFIKSLTDIMQFSYNYISKFLEISEKSENSSKYNNIVAYNVRRGIERSYKNDVRFSKDFGYYEYSPYRGKTKQNRITDGVGLAVTFFTLFMMYLYRDSSDSLSVDSINVGYDNDETYKLLNCNIEACFGNDWVGRYLHGKVRTTFSNEMFLKQRDSSLTESLHLNMCPITNELIVFDDNGNCLSRDLLENSLIFGLNVKNPKIDSFLNTCITNPTQLLSTVGLMCCLSGIIIEPKVVDNIDNDGIFRGKFLEAQSEIIKKQSKIAELEKELDLVRRSSLFKVKNLEHSLSASLETSERLSNEIKDLKATISSITEERVSSYSEPEIIIEPLEVNKLAFLNDYKILIVGGRMDLAKVLNDFGWTNIIQVDNIQNLSGSIPSIDFICFNTAFLSHSLFDSVRSKYSNMFDRMYYFNGTNKSALVDTSYSFVKNYLDL